MLALITSCKDEPKLACVDVAAAVKKWADVSGEEGGASISRSVLEQCSEQKWSETRKKCVTAAFGEAEPAEAYIACESGDSKNAGADYAKKSKTAEANQFLKKMSDSARTYYATPEFQGDVNSLNPAAIAKQMPVSVGPTPPLGHCCKDGGQCKPGSGDWDAPTWVALDFAMMDPHYFSYEFKTEGTSENGDLSFTALAYGDLDCDGTYSTYSLYGALIDGEIQSAGDVIKANPLE